MRTGLLSICFAFMMVAANAANGLTITQGGLEFDWSMSADVDGVVSGSGENFPDIAIELSDTLTSVTFTGTLGGAHNFLIKDSNNAVVAGSEAKGGAFTYEWTPSADGVYTYYCAPHISSMNGQITVTTAGVCASRNIEAARDAPECCKGSSESSCGLTCNSAGCAAECSGSECGMYCSGEGCAAGCLGQECGTRCDAEGCSAKCTGDFCGKECRGEACAAECTGENCGFSIFATSSDDVTVNCKGEGCAAKCSGTDCGFRCTGKDCACECTGDNCGEKCTGENCGPNAICPTPTSAPTPAPTPAPTAAPTAAPEDEVTVDEANTTHTDDHSHADDGEAGNTTKAGDTAGATAITAVVVTVFGVMVAAIF